MEFQQIIEATRSQLRNAQASYTDESFKADRIKKPLMFFLIMDRRFNPQLRDQRKLLERGKVVWGSIIQANDMLFDPKGMHGCLPAVVMYSEDPRYDDDPEMLVEDSHKMYELKGEVCTPEMQAFGDKLQNEMVADTKLPIPTGFTEGRQCYYATLLIARKHLPVRHLANNFFPVLINPQETDTVMILPKQYWEPTFRHLWGE